MFFSSENNLYSKRYTYIKSMNKSTYLLCMPLPGFSSFKKITDHAASSTSQKLSRGYIHRRGFNNVEDLVEIRKKEMHLMPTIEESYKESEVYKKLTIGDSHYPTASEEVKIQIQNFAEEYTKCILSKNAIQLTRRLIKLRHDCDTGGIQEVYDGTWIRDQLRFARVAPFLAMNPDVTKKDCESDYSSQDSEDDI